MTINVGKQQIIDNIHNRIDGTVAKDCIHDVITVICDYAMENLSDDSVFSVSNFGTLSPYLFHGHRGVNVVTGRMQNTKPFKTVRFRSHTVFKKLVTEKRERFLAKK